MAKTKRERLLVYIPNKPGNYVTRKRPNDESEVYPFLASDEHEGLQVCEVDFRDALDLVRATPWLYFPYYKGMKPRDHQIYTPRKHINPGIAAQILEKPAEMAKGLLDGFDHRPVAPRERVPDDMKFGPDDGPPPQPPDGPDAGVKDGSRPPVDRDGEEVATRTVSSEEIELPATIEEAKATHYDDLRMTLAQATGRKLSEVQEKKDLVIDALAVIAAKRGQPIDGYVPTPEGNKQGE